MRGALALIGTMALVAGCSDEVPETPARQETEIPEDLQQADMTQKLLLLFAEVYVSFLQD